jgi:predicted deacylase
MQEKSQRNSSNRPFWHALKRGFHRRRIGNRGTGFECFIWRGKPGPALVLNAATHGDEYEGPTFLHELVRDWRPKALTGTVVAIPVLNEDAFLAGRRCAESDGKNLARVFPGNASGTRTERIAHLFRTRVLRFADYYADFHSAGAAYEILPWVGYMMTDDADVLEGQRKMARCFDRYWCWGAPGLPGRTLSAAAELGVPAIYTESRGCGAVAQEDLEVLRRSTMRLLKAFGFVPGRVRLTAQEATRESGDKHEAHLQWQHPAPCDGLVVDVAPIGTKRKKGQPLCGVQPLTGGKTIRVNAMRSGTVVFIRRQRSIRKGESLGTVVPLP